jgi:hypothetical protein
MSRLRGTKSSTSSPNFSRTLRSGYKRTGYSTSSFNYTVQSAASIKNDQIEYSLKNDDNLIKLNELLTRTLIQARNNLDDLSDLTTKKLGPKAALYHHFFDDASDSMAYDSRELRDDSMNKTQRKMDSQEGSKVRQNQRKIPSIDLGDLSIPNEMLMKQLKVTIILTFFSFLIV